MQQIPLLAGHEWWAIAATILIAASVILTAFMKLTSAVKALTLPLKQFVAEHNILWEDYNLRTGGQYRRSRGRGSPPDPEEFYRLQSENSAPA
jgi:hypothetical protein